MVTVGSPIVSVIVPVYNGGQHIRAAINSLFLQDYPHLEIIAINDGSTDQSHEILSDLQKNDARLFVKSRENRGIVDTLNEGLALARGELIARMDADDISYPSRIGEQVKAFAAEPRLALCGTGIDLILSEQKAVRVEEPSVPDKQLSVLNLFHSVLAHPTVMFNRNVIGRDQLKYDAAYQYAEDFELFSRIARVHPIKKLPEKLLAYRVHPGGLTAVKAHKMGPIGFRIVSQNLAALGIRIDPLSLSSKIYSSGNPRQDATELLRIFATIRVHGLTLHDPERQFFEQGFEHLVRVTVNTLCSQGKFGTARTFCQSGNYWNVLRKRERLFLRWRTFVPLVSWKLFQFASRAVDLQRSVPIETLVPRYQEIIGKSSNMPVP